MRVRVRECIYVHYTLPNRSISAWRAAMVLAHGECSCRYSEREAEGETNTRAHAHVIYKLTHSHSHVHMHADGTDMEEKPD